MLLATTLLANNDEKFYNSSNENSNSCIQVLCNDRPIENGAYLTKSNTGIITVQNNIDKQISFNLILKTNINKANQPPIFLRFVKLNQLELQKVLSYAKSGDEIYIEQFVENRTMQPMCSPSMFVVS